MALDAGVSARHIVHLGRVEDVGARWVDDMFTAWAVATLTSDGVALEDRRLVAIKRPGHGSELVGVAGQLLAPVYSLTWFAAALLSVSVAIYLAIRLKLSL